MIVDFVGYVRDCDYDVYRGRDHRRSSPEVAGEVLCGRGRRGATATHPTDTDEGGAHHPHQDGEETRRRHRVPGPLLYRRSVSTEFVYFSSSVKCQLFTTRRQSTAVL